MHKKIKKLSLLHLLTRNKLIIKFNYLIKKQHNYFINYLHHFLHQILVTLTQ